MGIEVRIVEQPLAEIGPLLERQMLELPGLIHGLGLRLRGRVSGLLSATRLSSATDDRGHDGDQLGGVAFRLQRV
jgi:hypothetical protein